MLARLGQARLLLGQRGIASTISRPTRSRACAGAPPRWREVYRLFEFLELASRFPSDWPSVSSLARRVSSSSLRESSFCSACCRDWAKA